jgi:protein-S-isoprenylcysteine O-methyltransferase Ste14
LAAAGILLRFISAAYLDRPVLEKDRLVTDGPYAFMRNPRYFSNILILTGMVIAAGGLLPHLLWIAIFFFSIQYSVIAKYEEHHLIDKFGDDYQLYAQLVPRFYPRLSPYPERKRLKGDFGSAFKVEKIFLLTVFFVLVLFELRWNLINF